MTTGAVHKKMKLDRIDRRILSDLQGNGRMTNVDLANNAGISAPPCLRRVRALEENQVIKGYYARLNGSKLGYTMTAFLTVRLKNQNDKDVKIFEQAIQSMDNIREAYVISGDYDLLLVGLGKSIFEGTLLGKVIGFTSRIINPERLLDKFTGKEGLFVNSPFDERTRQIVLRVKMPLGVLIDKDLKEVNQVFVPIFCSEDSFLIDYAQKLIYNNNTSVTFLDMKGHMESNFVIASAIGSLKQKFPNNVILNNESILYDEFLQKQDLMIVSLDSWKDLLDSRSTWLSGVPSVLIIKP